MKKLVVVYAGDTLEAGRIHSLLQGEGLRATLQGSNMGMLEPWAMTAGGVASVQVCVPDTEVEKAQQILELIVGQGDSSGDTSGDGEAGKTNESTAE